MFYFGMFFEGSRTFSLKPSWIFYYDDINDHNICSTLDLKRKHKKKNSFKTIISKGEPSRLIVEHLRGKVYLIVETCVSKCFLIEKYGILNRIIIIKKNVECTQVETAWRKKD